MAITAKVKCTGREDAPYAGDGFQQLHFSPDYQDNKNKEWAAATPSLTLSMVVNAQVAGRFAPGKPYTLTFSEESG